MLTEAVVAAAAAGGTAVVEAAGSDLWAWFRKRCARLVGRGDPGREDEALERLDRTAAVLDAADEDEREQVRDRHVRLWQEEFSSLLESLEEADRARSHGRTAVAEGGVRRRCRRSGRLGQHLPRARGLPDRQPQPSGQPLRDGGVSGHGPGEVTGNSFHGPVAFQTGAHSTLNVNHYAVPPHRSTPRPTSWPGWCAPSGTRRRSGGGYWCPLRCRSAGG